MATTAQIAELRNAVQQPDNVEPYTDEFMASLIDTYGMSDATAKIWDAKAASVSKLVDVSEGGSTRKLSQVFDNYTALADRARAAGGSSTTAGYAPRSRKATRV